MARLKLTLEYDGTAYVGWQIQPNGRSLQATVEHALSQLLKEKVAVRVAGRTDAGVHAEGQVVSFCTDKRLPLKAYLQGLGSLLPDDIAVVDAREVPDDFDPRHWAVGKRYRYLISNRPVRSPLRRRTHWELFAPLDVGQMATASVHLIGRHDFSAFRAADCNAAHPVREIHRILIDGAGAELAITVDGTAFLKHMVRNLVGTLVEVGKGRRSPDWVAQVLASRDRTQAGPTAPAHGLTLVEVRYGEGPRARQRDADFEDD